MYDVSIIRHFKKQMSVVNINNTLSKNLILIDDNSRMRPIDDGCILSICKEYRKLSFYPLKGKEFDRYTDVL